MADEQHPDWITTELRRAAVTERAPAHLRLQIDELSRRQSTASRRPTRRVMLVPAVGLIAAVVLALLLILPGGTPGGPTVAQAAALGARPVAYAPPADDVSRASQTKEYARFANVRFPKALDDGRWKFQTWRIARLDGRQVLAIYYTYGSQEVSYLVAATPKLVGQQSGFTSFTVGGRNVASWQESNHSCLLTSATVSQAALLQVARS